MTTPLRRRWFRFSLRTLLVVVTICAVWLGWNLRIVRERQAILAALKKPNDPSTYVVTLADMESSPARALRPWQYEYAHLPLTRRLLGDQPFLQIAVRSDVDRQLLERAEHAFPEVMFIVYAGECLEDRWVQSSRDPLIGPAEGRQPNIGDYFKTGLIEKSPAQTLPPTPPR